MLTRNQNQILTATLIARIPTLCRMQKEYGICPYMTITTPNPYMTITSRESGNQITHIITKDIDYATKDGVNYPPHTRSETRCARIRR